MGEQYAVSCHPNVPAEPVGYSMDVPQLVVFECGECRCAAASDTTREQWLAGEEQAKELKGGNDEQ